MSASSSGSPLELRDELNPRFQRAEWIAQRVIWACMALAILAALLGFAGSGPFARTSSTATIAGGEVTVTHSRVARFHAPERLTIAVDAPGASGDRLRVVVPHALGGAARRVAVSPDPQSADLGDGATTYEWPVTDWGEPARVTIEYAPDDLGVISGELRIVAGDSAEAVISLDQFVLP